MEIYCTLTLHCFFLGNYIAIQQSVLLCEGDTNLAISLFDHYCNDYCLMKSIRDSIAALENSGLVL